VLAVRWYLRYGLFYRDVEELLAERGITVDQPTLRRRVKLGVLAARSINASPCATT
jgi:transposase-like protein